MCQHSRFPASCVLVCLGWLASLQAATALPQHLLNDMFTLTAVMLVISAWHNYFILMACVFAASRWDLAMEYVPEDDGVDPPMPESPEQAADAEAATANENGAAPAGEANGSS